MAKEIVSFELTEKQTELLKGFFDMNEEHTGMIIGQFFNATEGPGFVKVGYIDSEEAKKIQEASGIKPGELSQEEHSVYVDME